MTFPSQSLAGRPRLQGFVDTVSHATDETPGFSSLEAAGTKSHMNLFPTPGNGELAKESGGARSMVGLSLKQSKPCPEQQAGGGAGVRESMGGWQVGLGKAGKRGSWETFFLGEGCFHFSLPT